MQLLESSCDRRFLHAVVASDYRLMYRELSSTKRQGFTTRKEPETVLESDAQVFSSIETILQDRPLAPSHSRLAVSNPDAANKRELWHQHDHEKHRCLSISPASSINKDYVLYTNA